MDKKAIEQHLKEADEAIQLGAEHVRKQKRILAHLETDGHDTKMARELLDTFEALQQTHIEGRETVAEELAQKEREEARSIEAAKTKSGRTDAP